MKEVQLVKQRQNEEIKKKGEKTRRWKKDTHPISSGSCQGEEGVWSCSLLPCKTKRYNSSTKLNGVLLLLQLLVGLRRTFTHTRASERSHAHSHTHTSSELGWYFLSKRCLLQSFSYSPSYHYSSGFYFLFSFFFTSIFF